MKYIKICMLFVAALLMASCSDDDESINSNSTTIGFANETIVVKENVGFFNVPINIEGARNGDIKLTVEASASGANGAVEDVNYMITDKTLSLLNDTTTSETLNIQIKTIDDQEINENREFKLKITSAEGGQLQRSEVTVVLRDNDAAFFEKFFGKWTITFTDHEGVEQKKTMTISGPTDEEDPDYDNILTATCPSMFNVGVALNCEWHFRYTFDSTTKKGTLGFMLGETIATYSTSYAWVWACDDGVNYTFDDITTEWSLDANDKFPTTITWQPEQYMYLLMTNGFWDTVEKISITKQ